MCDLVVGVDVVDVVVDVDLDAGNETFERTLVTMAGSSPAAHDIVNASSSLSCLSDAFMAA